MRLSQLSLVMQRNEYFDIFKERRAKTFFIHGIINSKLLRIQMHPTAIVEIQGAAFQDIFLNLETLQSPGAVGNCGPLLPLPVRLSI
jgi:hypothetical protein